MTDLSTDTAAATPSNRGGPLVQLGMTAWLIASFIVMFALGEYTPGVGASGPGSAIGAMMFGGYFLACSTLFRGYFLYRLKVLRITGFWGDDAEPLAHGMYMVFGVVFVLAGLTLF